MPRTLELTHPPLDGKWKPDGIPWTEYPKAPDGSNECRWCHGPVKGTNKQKVWCGPVCVAEFQAAKGNSGPLRSVVFDRDKGMCARCGLDCRAFELRMRKRVSWAKRAGRFVFLTRLRNACIKRGFDHWNDSHWQADHILARHEGGDSQMSNIQTLCIPCHKHKTAQMRTRLAKRTQ